MPPHFVFGHIDLHTSVRLSVRTCAYIVRNSSFINKGTIAKLLQMVVNLSV